MDDRASVISRDEIETVVIVNNIEKDINVIAKREDIIIHQYFLFINLIINNLVTGKIIVNTCLLKLTLIYLFHMNETYLLKCSILP